MWCGLGASCKRPRRATSRASTRQAVGAQQCSLPFTADRGFMNRVITGSPLTTAENTLVATVEVPLTTAHQQLTGTPAPQAAAGFSRFVVELFTRHLQPLGAATQAGSGHNQLWIRDLPFLQQRCRTARAGEPGEPLISWLLVAGGDQLTPSLESPLQIRFLWFHYAFMNINR
jgi:hypothetical protein